MSEADKKPKLVMQHFLVGFLDMVGQKNRLAEMAARPLEDVQSDEMLALLRGTFGALRTFRNGFQQFCEASEEIQIDLTKLPADQQEEFRKLAARKVHLQPLSDAVVVYVPLADGETLPINGVYTALGACAQAVLIALAAGHPCRGGIDVGWAAEINEGEMYGPGLYSAYQLESKVAQQPRVAVGTKLFEYIAAIQQIPGDDIRARITRIVAGLCGGLVGWDVDGQPILDYLGEGHRSVLTPEVRQSLATEVLPRAYTFVRDQERGFREAGDGKLGPRYKMLLDYFESRLPLWADDGWREEEARAKR